MRVGILASGQLGYKTISKLNGLDIRFVFTDSKSEKIKDFCETQSIPCFLGNPRKSPEKVNKFLNDKNIDVLLSINYLFIVEENILNHPEKYAINFHGSLLPKYRGRTPHVWAVINDEKDTGITAHLMDANCDTGAIVKNVNIAINDNDTGNALLEKFENIYPEFILSVLEDVENNNVVLKQQDHTKATYFGKRTPNDGQINWKWQKERIYNWVRAQSYPYPGAFTYYNGQQIIIDRISFSDYGFSYDDENGLILQIKPKVLIKTPNGAISLEKIRYEAEFKAGDKFE